MTGEAWMGIAAIIASFATLVTAIGGVIVSIRTTRKADALLVKSEAIHKSTNSNLALVTANLAIANAKIDAMQTAATEKDESLQKLLTGLVADRKPVVTKDDVGESY